MGKIKSFFRGWHEKKITFLLLTAGVGLLSAAFIQSPWFGLLTGILNEKFGFHTKEIDNPNYVMISFSAIIGIGLITLGIWFYFKTKSRAKKKIMLKIQHASIEATNFSKTDQNLFDYDLEPFSINQLEEMKTVSQDNINHALIEQKKTANKLLQRFNDNDEMELSYWGLAHIPYLFLLGYQLADKIESSFFEWNQNKLRWEKVKEKKVSYPSLKVTKDTLRQSEVATKELVIRIGITYPVKEQQLDGLNLGNLNSYYLHLDPPRRNAIVCIEQLNDYQKTFRKVLDEINQTYPNLEKIHLFYSGQPSLAYRLGSSISPRMDMNKGREIWVYNYLGPSSPSYNWALTLNKADKLSQVKVTGGN